MVKTKTRSKNSSSVLTRGSVEAAEYEVGMAEFTDAELTFLIRIHPDRVRSWGLKETPA